MTESDRQDGGIHQFPCENWGCESEEDLEYVHLEGMISVYCGSCRDQEAHKIKKVGW